jgi:hypothetical protein
MASSSSVIFPESMADFLANPINIYFGSMSAESTAPTAYLVIEGNAITSNQQVETDLLAETNPPTPHDLITVLDHVEDMVSDTIKVYERAKRPRRTSTPSPRMPLGLQNAAHVASHYMKNKIHIQSGPKIPHRGNCRGHLDDPCPTRTPNTQLASAVCSRNFVVLSSRLIAARSTVSHLRTVSHSRSLE